MTTNTLNFLPSLGMTGFYSLAAPYDKLISATAQYRCEGVKSLSAALSEGQDPLTQVYLASGDTKENYERDLAAGVSLVSISAGDGSLVVFPHTAMLKVPLADGVVYENVVLSIALGALPQTQDLSLIQSEIQQMVLQNFGINSASYLSVVGAPCIISAQAHEVVQAARQAKITEQESSLSKVQRLQTQLSAALTKIAELEAHLVAQM